MTARERILAAVRHRETDRLPLDLGGMGATGLSAFLHNPFRQALGLPPATPRVFDPELMVAEVDTALLDRVGADAVYLSLPKWPGCLGESWKDWTLPDGTTVEIPAEFGPVPDGSGGFLVPGDGGVLARMPPGGTCFDTVHAPLPGIDRIGDLAQIEAGTIGDRELAALERKARTLRASSDRAVILYCGTGILSRALRLRGFEAFMTDMILEETYAHALVDRILERRLRTLRRCLDRLAPWVDLVECSDDLGSQNGPLLDPAQYKAFIAPAHAALFAEVHRFGKPVLMHSCGSIAAFLPTLAEIGADILNPVQTTARDMDPVFLKREFGRDFTFWGGGCDTQGVLPHGTPQQVMDHVRRQVDILGRGGGYVFAQVHNLQPDVPVANLLAMYRAVGALA